MKNSEDVTLRKRQQIDSSNKTMFIVVAITAFVAGISLVVSFFLVQQISFHTKIISAKQQTLNLVKSNIDTAEKLKDNVRVLETNPELNAVKSSASSSALQVILDALPAEANADALGASIQNHFAGPVEGLTIESLSVSSLDGDGSVEGEVSFSMSVSGSADAMKQLLNRFEKSIRVISLTAVEIQAGDGGLVMSLSGYANYELTKEIKIETKVVKP